MNIRQGNLLGTLRERYSDPMLTVLTALLLFVMFVVAPLQAVGIVIFQAFGIFAALAMMSGVLVLSGSSTAVIALLIAILMNSFVIILRLRGTPVAIRPSSCRRRLADLVDHPWFGCGARSIRTGCNQLSPHRRCRAALSLDCPDICGAVRFCWPSYSEGLLGTLCLKTTQRLRAVPSISVS